MVWIWACNCYGFVRCNKESGYIFDLVAVGTFVTACRYQTTTLKGVVAKLVAIRANGRMARRSVGVSALSM